MTAPLVDRPHALYRFYDRHDRLLYVGITADLPTRLMRHNDEKPWWINVNHITIEHFGDRNAVLQAERLAITTERPAWNVQHNQPRRATMAALNPGDVRRVMAGDADFLVLPIGPPPNPRLLRILVARENQYVEVTLNRDMHIDWCLRQGKDGRLHPEVASASRRAIEASVHHLRALGHKRDLEVSLDERCADANSQRWVTLHLSPPWVLHGVEALTSAELRHDPSGLEWLTDQLAGPQALRSASIIARGERGQ